VKRFWAFLPLAIFLAIPILGAWAMFSLRMDKKASPLIGKPAPTLVLPAIQEGKPPLVLSDLKGRVVVVNFMASWCAPCREEHPILMQAANDPRFVLVGIAYKDKPSDTITMLQELGDPFAALGADRDGTTGIAFGLTGVPETYVIDSEGTVIAKHTGPLDAPSLKRLIAPAIGARPSTSR
jgi:cytochrome c biogenesis protein CcmG, thiol:disulfide interchange protein DsbE